MQMANLINIRIGEQNECIDLGNSVAFEMLVETMSKRYDDQSNRARIEYSAQISFLDIESERDYKNLTEALTELANLSIFPDYLPTERRQIFFDALNRLKIWLEKFVTS